jgi:hypothetical protein
VTLIAQVITSIPQFAAQQDPSWAVGTAMGLYSKLYAPLEAWNPDLAVPRPALEDLARPGRYILECFSWDGLDMMERYLKDLLLYRLLKSCGYTSAITDNLYKDMMDEIRSKRSRVSFLDIDAVATFTDLDAE